MSRNVELNIYNAVNRLEGLKGRRYSDNEIARAMGVHRHTVASIRKGRHDALLSKLLTFFASQGMPIGIADLFVVTSDGPPYGD